jgi:hypothetical protein
MMSFKCLATWPTFHNVWHTHYIITGDKYSEGSNFLVGADTCDLSETAATHQVGFRSLEL